MPQHDFNQALYESGFLVLLGCNCSTAVEHTSNNQEVKGSNHAESWAFFLLQAFPTFLHKWSVPQGDSILTVCCESKKKLIPICAVCEETGSINSDWLKNELGPTFPLLISLSLNV